MIVVLNDSYLFSFMKNILALLFFFIHQLILKYFSSFRLKKVFSSKHRLTHILCYIKMHNSIIFNKAHLLTFMKACDVKRQLPHILDPILIMLLPFRVTPRVTDKIKVNFC